MAAMMAVIMSNRQLARFCFTWFVEDGNSPEDCDPASVSAAFDSTKCSYLVYQLERCPTSERLHWQGYVRMPRSVRFNVLKNKLPSSMHLEACRGSEGENIQYCTKEDSRVRGPWEIGDRAAPGKRRDLDYVREQVQNGKKFREIAFDPEVHSFQGLKGAQLLLGALPLAKREPPDVYWLHGSTGSGKTRWAWECVERMKEEMWVSNDSLQWFDGYNGEKVVLIDDFRASFCSFGFLLRLLDRYPMRVPVKGSFVQWVPEVIIVTSPMHPKYSYKRLETNDGELQQLLRRITHCLLFGDEVIPPPVVPNVWV